MLSRIILTITLVGMLMACGDQSTASKPVVAIISPPTGSHYAGGEQVTMNLSAASGSVIRKVEIRSGSSLLATEVYTGAVTTHSALITFLPTQTGEIPISVIAINQKGQSSDPAKIIIYVGALSVFPTDVALTVTASPPPADLSGCQLAATYVADITIPDGSALTAGTVYTKTWQVRNTSQCAWLDGYVLAFMDGERMNAPMSVPVSPTARDATVDIHVPVTAPSSSGVYSSTWRMRAPDGIAFGNRLYMVIHVP